MSVELIDSMGGDLSIVRAARVSLGRDAAELGERERRLIGRLLRDRHASPFEHVVFTFRVRCPIGVAREWMRHRDSFNEFSTRYAEAPDEFYVPDPADVRRQVGGSIGYAFESVDAETAADARGCMERAYEQAYESYRAMLAHGIARELARNVLPLGLLTSFYWTVKLRALFNFLSLRMSPSALLEIRREAEEVERRAENVVPVAMAAWRECGRVPL